MTAVYEVHTSAVPLVSEHAQRLGFDRVAPVGEDKDDPPWDRAWARDILAYLGRDPVYRKWHHDELVGRANAQGRMLPLSCELFGDGAPLDRLFGDEWLKRAHLRLLIAWTWALPGDKLLFMGWKPGAGIEHLVGDLNRLRREEPALHDGRFEWVDDHDEPNSTASFLRRGPTADVLCAFNFTPVPRPNHRAGVPADGPWTEIFDSEASEYGGSGHGNLGGVEAGPVPAQGRPFSLTLTLPPLGAVFLRRPL